RPAAVPTVKGEDLVLVVDMMDVDVVALESLGGVVPVAPQANQIAVQVPNAREPLDLGPVEFPGVRPGSPFEELLSHEQHRDPGSGPHQGCAAGRASLRE